VLDTYLPVQSEKGGWGGAVVVWVALVWRRRAERPWVTRRQMTHRRARAEPLRRLASPRPASPPSQRAERHARTGEAMHGAGPGRGGAQPAQRAARQAVARAQEQKREQQRRGTKDRALPAPFRAGMR